MLSGALLIFSCSLRCSAVPYPGELPTWLLAAGFGANFSSLSSTLAPIVIEALLRRALLPQSGQPSKSEPSPGEVFILLFNKIVLRSLSQKLYPSGAAIQKGMSDPARPNAALYLITSRTALGDLFHSSCLFPLILDFPQAPLGRSAFPPARSASSFSTLVLPLIRTLM